MCIQGVRLAYLKEMGDLLSDFVTFFGGLSLGVRMKTCILLTDARRPEAGHQSIYYSLTLVRTNTHKNTLSHSLSCVYLQNFPLF